jgi:TolB-like protein/thioredoxin-like negative regulator of GroEL
VERRRSPAPTPNPAVDAARSRHPARTIGVVVLSLALLGAIAFVAWRHREQPPATAAAPAAANAHPSLAVLPFVDMSEEQDQAHFAEGLSEEILNLLAHADNLRVIARTSSFSFKGENVDIKTIAQRLEVAYVLEGSVRKQGDRLRITAQLIDASTSAHRWSDTYDRDVHDIFGVQREIASHVADALRVTLAREGPRRAETASTEAYEHYLQGRHLFNRRAPGDLEQAKAHFDQAVRIDPGYARAWAALAGVYFVSRYSNVDFPDAMKQWGIAVDRAVSLDPELAEGHMRAAQYYWQAHQQKVADAHLARATALDPEDPMVIAASMSEAIVNGQMEDAIRMQRRIVTMDPLSASHRANLGSFLMAVGRFPEAQAELERSLELSPASDKNKLDVADVLILQGRTDEALEVLARTADGFERDARLAIVAFARHDTREGETMLARIEALARQPDYDPGVNIALAAANAARHDSDRAFAWLQRAVDRSQSQHKVQPNWVLLEALQVTPYFRPLHADARWGAILAKVRAELW